MSQFLLQVLIIAIGTGGMLAPPGPGTVPPTVYKIYESKGVNQLLVDEGAPIRTTHGMSSISNISVYRCADTCYQTFKDCNCCNSFSYNPAQKECYLKNRTQDASIETLYNSDGWQSYWYGGIGFSNTGCSDAYKGDLPGTIIMRISWPGYKHYYVSVGNGKLAANEGEAIKTVEGYDYISDATPELCAKGCDDTAECDGFSYNPFQDNGKCYLKKNTTNGRYTVVDSYEGWTFYWKDTSSVNCWCSCASEYACVGCDVWGACVAF